MAITPAIFDFLMSVMPPPEQWQGLRMFEFGNQHLHSPGGYEMEYDGFIIAKQWFESKGIHHVSLDLNGWDGALQRDICGDLSDLGQFDIVTNFGSAEHVDNQFACWNAFDDLCKVGGIMVHAAPPIGHWPLHCNYRYSDLFFSCLASYNAYHTIKRAVTEECGEDRHLILVAYKKVTDRDVFIFPSGEVNEVKHA